MRLTPQGDYEGFAARVFPAASNSGEVTDMGRLVLFRPGGVSGEVLESGATGGEGNLYVAIPDLGVAAATSAGSGYAVSGVAPGKRNLVLLAGAASQTLSDVMVEPSSITTPVNFDLRNLVVGAGTIYGSAKVLDGTREQIVVQATDSLTGRAVASDRVDASGEYELLDLPPGAYVVTARSMGSSKAAYYPGVVVAAKEEKELHFVVSEDSDASVFGGDLDGDGVPDLFDPDDENDGELDGLPEIPNGSTGGGVANVTVSASDTGTVSSDCYEENGESYLSAGIYIGYYEGDCDNSVGFFIARNIPVSGSVKEAYLFLTDSGSGFYDDGAHNVRLLMGPAAGNVPVPTTGPEAIAAHAGATPLFTFDDDDEGTLIVLDVTTQVAGAVARSGWRRGVSDLPFFLDGPSADIGYDTSKIRLMIVY